MEMKYRPVIVLDACSIINLIYAEIEYGSEFVTRRLKKDDFHLGVCQKVIDEAFQNSKIQFRKLKTNSSKKDFYDKEKEIERRIASFREFVTQNESIKKELGEKYFGELKKITGYHKNNGEFYSVALALYISRLESCQLTFYTDDFPARAEFGLFFRSQQIGVIADSVDLLIFLYWLHPDFEKKHLIFFLTELRSQYATDVKILYKRIKAYKEKQSAKQLKEIRKPLNQLEHKLQRHNLEDVNKLKKAIFRNGKKHRPLCEILEQFESVFTLEEASGDNIITKIQKTLQNVEADRIFKIW